VKETYYIGPNASAIEVYSIAFVNNYIYAATESGIYFANKSSANLADYNEWQKIGTLPFPNAKYTHLLNFESQLLVSYLNTGDNTSIIYKQNGADWTEFYNSATLVKQITASNGSLFVIENQKVSIYSSNLIVSKTITNYGFGNTSPNDAYTDEQNTIYIADNEYGLVICKNDNYSFAMPNGPYTNHVADIDTYNDQVWVAGGGHNSFWGNIYNYPEAYAFRNETWQSYIQWNSGAHDFIKVLINPYNPSQVYFGAWGAGVFVFENDELKTIYNETNSSLQSIYPGDEFIRIGGLFIDEAQNLYVTNSGVNAPISVRTADGNWYSYNYPEISGYGTVGEIINTVYNHKWVQLARGGGLFVFNDNGTPDDMSDDETRRFSIFDENGQIITGEVFSLAEDKEGVVWVGTDQGVFTYYNPQNFYSGDNFYADRIKVIDTQNDTIVQYLLAKEKITAIAIDGANRKWFGTESSGVFLMSADGRDEIFHFNTQNSKLISNNITTIAVDGKTGEVFIGTNLGMVSFKGTATEGNASYAGAYVYPNPVRENYDGPITITGLAGNANVKVTDITGQLVYETTAFGGQAIWNGKNYSGKKVHTGVYLVFCTDEKGKNKKILKLLVIN